MRQGDKEGLMQQLLPIARVAGGAIMAVYYRGMPEAQLKEDDSPVTEADLAAHRVLASQLKPLLSECPVVSEEDAGSLIHCQSHGRFWLVDPLDGTKEFIARNGEFTVNIALIENGRCVLGIVYAPAIDALYWGGAGLGAFRCIGGQTAAIKVAASNLGKASRVVASKSHLNEATRSFIDRLGEVSLVQAGSSLKFCRVAEGEADIYPRLAPTCEWDTAAAQAVLEGAGGVVINLQGTPLLYGKPNVLNPSFIATRDTALIPA
jgi:3'(2'), 5'-bisphosphate nucleotidase